MIFSSTHHLQHGSILMVTLLVMLVLTILATTQVSLNSSQTRIATNSADAQIAFQTAEGAINDATNNLLSYAYPPASFLSNANGLYLFNPNNPPLWTTVNWTNANAVILSFQGQSSAQSAYIIEQLPSVIKGGQNVNVPTQVYRITARAVGKSGSTPVILQSTIETQ